MPRIARAVAPGYPHHITQRGNYRQHVFEEEADYNLYLAWLKEYSDKYGLKIWAYCLMNNHIHLVCVPEESESLAKTFNTLHMRYSRHFNHKKGVKGHLWQGRFFSCVLDERHLHAAVRYVENHPVRGKVVESPDQYRWSSAAAHMKVRSNDLLANDCHLTKEITDWRNYLLEEEDKGLIDELRKNSMAGRPCGGTAFIETIESIVGRRLRPLPWGLYQ